MDMSNTSRRIQTVFFPTTNPLWMEAIEATGVSVVAAEQFCWLVLREDFSPCTLPLQNSSLHSPKLPVPSCIWERPSGRAFLVRDPVLWNSLLLVHQALVIFRAYSKINLFSQRWVGNAWAYGVQLVWEKDIIIAKNFNVPFDIL